MNIIDIGYPSLNNNKDSENINLLNKMIDDGKNVFLFIFWDKCGPCHQTIPKWKAIKKYNKDDIIALVNKDYFNELKNVGVAPMGFPTLRYINKTPSGLTIEEYDDSSFKGEKDRSVESFTNWIDYHNSQNGGKRKTKKNKKSRKSKRKSKRKSIKKTRKYHRKKK